MENLFPDEPRPEDDGASNYDQQEWRPVADGIYHFRNNEVTSEDLTGTDALIRAHFGNLIGDLISVKLLRAVLEHDRERMNQRMESNFAAYYQNMQEMKRRAGEHLTEESKRIWRDRNQEPPV